VGVVLVVAETALVVILLKLSIYDRFESSCCIQGAYRSPYEVGISTARIGRHIRTFYWRTNLSLRVEVVQRILFREPDGRRKGLVFSFFSLICILGWVYFGIVLNGPHNMLFLGVAFAFSGLAEFLPPTRQRSAGVLRILSLSVLVVFLVLLILMPELIWDWA